MTKILTPGKWRGLATTSMHDRRFAILAFDQRGSYRRMLPEGTSYETAVQIKREVVVSLAPHVSAVLLDAIYGLPAALDMAGSSGLLMALEKSGYSGEATYRRVEFIEGWTVARIKRMGASAVKLLVYYHPASGALAEEIEDTVRAVAADCERHDLPLFLEPIVYSLEADVPTKSAAFARTRPEVVRETARRLSKTGADVLKLEFPMDAAFDDDERAWQEACEAVSEACDVPWVLLSAGVDFQTFERQARVACQAGASGFLAGRAIWKEAVRMPPQRRAEFLAGEAQDRIYILRQIVSRYARPWDDFYTPVMAADDWFLTYSASP